MKVRRKEGALNAPGWNLLRAGQDYNVYGVKLSELPHFLVFEPDELSFPIFVVSDAVEIIDGRLSKFWTFAPALPATDLYSMRAPLIAFDAMARDRHYYQALVDGEVNAVAAWNEWRNLIDSETEE